MREIKFRAWDKEIKAMVYKPSVEAFAAGRVWLNPALNNSTYEWMQYTGLKDKNGKEIYEWDVVRCAYYDNSSFSENKHYQVDYLGVIEWVDDVYHHGYKIYRFQEQYHEKVMKEKYYSTFKNSENNLEVIGNIYENPELLK